MCAVVSMLLSGGITTENSGAETQSQPEETGDTEPMDDQVEDALKRWKLKEYRQTLKKAEKELAEYIPSIERGVPERMAADVDKETIEHLQDKIAKLKKKIEETS